MDIDPQLYQSLGNIEGKLDSLIATNEEFRRTTETRVEKVEARTSRLEQWQMKVLGGSAVVAASVGVLIKWLT